MALSEKERLDKLKADPEFLENYNLYYRGVIKPQKREEERRALVRFILKEWSCCKDIRAKIDLEGVGYFYYGYTSVPCHFELYYDFAIDDECWCGNCQSSSDDEKENE